jgi:hypothetical protein
LLCSIVVLARFLIDEQPIDFELAEKNLFHGGRAREKKWRNYCWPLSSTK